MKNLKTVTSGLLLGLSLSAVAEAKYMAGTYDIDPMHSKAGFEVPHLVISSVEGKFKTFEGKIDLNKDFSKTTVEALLDAKSIDTGVEKRDEHLRSADFFNTAEFPQIKFKSTKIEGKPDKFKLIGDLTIRGITKRVVIDSKYLGAVVDGYGNHKVALEGKTVINRKDFGLGWNSVVEAGPVVGDKITIELKIQAARPKEIVSAN